MLTVTGSGTLTGRLAKARPIGKEALSNLTQWCSFVLDYSGFLVVFFSSVVLVLSFMKA